MKKKRGLSPVVATVLLISMVIVLGLIVFLWLRGLISEDAIKDGKNIELVCGDVSFQATYETGGILTIINDNIPLYDIKIRYGGGGNYDLLSLRETASASWDKGLGQNGIFSAPVSGLSDAQEIRIAATLLGSVDEGNRVYDCDMEKHGVSII